MRHPCNLCSLQFATEKILEKHEASFHINPDASRVLPILPVVLEKIKIEPELITLDEDEIDDHQTTSTVQKQPPKAIFEKTVIPQIVKRLKPKDWYQCEVCLEKFTLLRYFRKHLATAEEQGFSKCQEYYKANINNGFVPVYNKSCVDGIANAKNGLTTEKEQSQSQQITTALNIQTCENSSNEERVGTKFKIGNRNKKQRSDFIEKQELSNIVDNSINFQQRYKNYFEFTGAAKCAVKAVSDDNSEKSLVIPSENQSKSSARNAEVEMPVLNRTETLPIPQVPSCKECHLTCASYEQLCIHYSKHHNLPVVVLKNVEKHELYRKYKRHVESVSKNKTFKCDTCEGKFLSRYYLKKHTTSGPCAYYNFSDDHLTAKNDISSSEIEVSKSRTDLCRKNILKYPKKPYELRKNKFFKSSLLRKYNTSANSQLCHKCNVCNRQFSSLTMLWKHKLAVHKNKKVSLNVQQRQGKLLSTSKEFHTPSAHDRFRFKCDLCQKDFSTKKYLKLHKRGAHDGFRHKCESCPKTFTQWGQLSLHKRTAHDCVRYKCESCPQTFSQKGHLNTHKRTVHDGVRYKCQLCQKAFTQLRNLNKHKQSVHDGVRHRCKSCPKEFTMFGYLKRHKLIAHDSILQKCEICLKEFTRMQHLKRHVLSVHDGLRHNCELCPKTFTQLEHLNTHKRTVHDGVRHRCELCRKTFTQLGYLNTHKRTVHDGVRNTCDICQKDFCSSRYLKQHKITVHDV